MFYLRKLRKLFKQSPVFLMTYLLLTLVCVFSINFHENIINIVEKNSLKDFKPPFFHALIDENQNYTRFSRKLRSLPGVKNVEILSPQLVKDQANEMLGNLNLGISTDLIDMGYAGLKVIFEANLQEKSIELVRDYLVRLVGKDSITIGDIIQSTNKKEDSFLIDFVQKNLSWIILTSSLLILSLINILFVRFYNNQLYLIENFQRKNNISLKIYLLLSSVVIIIPTLVSSLISFSLFNLFIIFTALTLGGVIHLRKRQWVA